MLIKLRHLLPYLVVILLLAFPLDSMAKSKSHAIYIHPSQDQIKRSEQLFLWLFQQTSKDEAKKLAISLGFLWKETKYSIRLKDNKNMGWGEYWFHKNIHSGIVLQAPHRYYDKHTGVIAMRIFKKQNITSIAMNSIPRNAQTEPSHESADLAHLSISFYTAYSRAFTLHYPQGHLIQLHGFNSNKRKTHAARTASIILSHSESWTSQGILKTQDCLNKKNLKSLRYPQQVKELGGTKNRIGALLRHLGHAGFIHLEMNLPTRVLLIKNENILSQFSNCLVALAS